MLLSQYTRLNTIFEPRWWFSTLLVYDRPSMLLWSKVLIHGIEYHVTSIRSWYWKTYFFALSFRKWVNSSSFWLPISRSRVVNLLCHSLQWLKSANFRGELSRSTKSILSTVSSFWKLLAISVYLERKNWHSALLGLKTGTNFSKLSVLLTTNLL